VWDVILHFVFDVLSWFESFTGDWGMAIICLTLVIRLLIFPIARKQFKSNHQMQKMQPLMQELQAKYADDKQKLSEEMQKLYSEAHFNPLAGCLPMVIQIPVFMAFFQMLTNLSKFIDTSSQSISFYNIIPDLTVSPSSFFTNGITSEAVIAAIPYAILVLLFSISTLIPMLLNKSTNQQMKWISYGMVVFMIFIGWSSPGGVLLYWDVSSFFGIAQQILTQKILDKKDLVEEESIVAKPVKVNVERRQAKPRPTRKSK
jgi:YidC/Oxa1 family membrane protein insertase